MNTNNNNDEFNFNLEQTIDHMSHRLWIGITCGLAMGASNATLRGMPLVKTSLSMGASCALAGTACLAFERIVFNLYGYANANVTRSINGNSNGNNTKQSLSNSNAFHSAADDNDEALLTSSSAALSFSSLDKVQLGVSHVLGGMGGGAISGGLFQGKPMAGAAYFMPLMCGVAFLEVKWHEYRMEQLRLLLLQEGQGRERGETEEEKRR